MVQTSFCSYSHLYTFHSLASSPSIVTTQHHPLISTPSYVSQTLPPIPNPSVRQHPSTASPSPSPLPFASPRPKTDYHYQIETSRGSVHPCSPRNHVGKHARTGNAEPQSPYVPTLDTDSSPLVFECEQGVRKQYICWECVQGMYDCNAVEVGKMR